MNEIMVKEISLDSRQAKPGDLFMAVRGLTVDGRDYIEQAIEKGVSAVLFECDPETTQWQSLVGMKERGVPVIPVSHLRKIMGPIAGRFFDDPSRTVSVIGVTGTNGKTSTTHYIAQLLGFIQQKCGVIGTLGSGFLDNLNETFCTTPDAIAVQRKLAEFKQVGTKTVAMEVTSHALDQYRVEGVQFRTAVFTNLTRDHLDYHASFAEYGAAKQKLFLDFRPENSLINLDDEFGQTLAMNPLLRRADRKVIGYTINAHLNSIREKLDGLIVAETMVLDDNGIEAFLKTPWGEGSLRCCLLGHFNLSNVLAALGAACLEGMPFTTVLEAVKSLKPVNGRMMRLGGQNALPLVVVDYAHTPDALTQVLKAARIHCRGKLWCVFGCGGDRDRGKRPLMAAAVEEFCDHVTVTQDNPRTENPNQILEDILLGFKQPERVNVESDRRLAIHTTIQSAKPEDCIVVAGKGHEAYQIIGNEKFPFSDALEIQTALNRISQ